MQTYPIVQSHSLAYHRKRIKIVLECFSVWRLDSNLNDKGTIFVFMSLDESQSQNDSQSPRDKEFVVSCFACFDGHKWKEEERNHDLRTYFYDRFFNV